MPIARVMNMPDGSTPPPTTGGGDSNGTMATSIIFSHAGTTAAQLGVPAQLHFGSSLAGIPSVAVAAADSGESQPIALAESGEPDPAKAEDTPHAATTAAADRATGERNASRHERARSQPNHRSGRDRRR